MSKLSTVLIISSGAIGLALLLGNWALSSHQAGQVLFVERGPAEVMELPEPPAAQLAPRDLSPRNTTNLPRPPESGKRLDEDSLLAKLHELAATNPLVSLQLAREAVARFPDSPHASEFEWNVVKSLANMERYAEAREEARLMVDKYPRDEFSDDVYRHLLNHPPNPQDVLK